MNKLICLASLFVIMISSNVLCQDIDIVQILKEDVCECTLQQVKRPYGIQGSVLEDCLNKKVDSYPEMFKITLEKENFVFHNTSSKEFSVNFDNLNAFIAGHQKYFVNHCESYYWYASRLREKRLLIYRDIDVEKTLKTLDRKLKRKKEEDKHKHLLDRAKIYMSTGRYEQAENDLKQILNKNSNYEEALFHLAWTYELKHKFAIAKNLYIKLIKKNNNFDAILGLECVNRKIIEKYDDGSDDDVKNKSKKPIDSLALSMDRIEIPPIPRACIRLKDAKKIKECFSSYMKQLVRNQLLPTIESYDNIKSGIQRILVYFKVSKEGFITNIKIRGADPYISNEITRIVSSVPPLKPGTVNGKPVGVLYSLPIAFEIVNND